MTPVKIYLNVEELMFTAEVETYMTGQKAIGKGFVVNFAESAALEVSDSTDRDTLFICEIPH